MKINDKRGITVSSLVLYVVLFFGLTAFLSTVYSNLNKSLFDNRGIALNYTNLNKLQYNITDSAFKSNDVIVESNSLKYSNGDIYTYNENNDTILLNGGVLCTSVSRFTPIITTENGVKKVEIQLTLNKYLTTVEKTIITSIEVE
jgi:hypothetical protein